ncbi:MAG: bis-aminopropyl spermidine synthase family protein, partial [Armatimonadota bacterium]
MDTGILNQVASASRLHEGDEGVRRVLRVVYREGPLPLKALARHTRLPVPVVAAVRRELEKRDLLRRAGGVTLTRRGRRFVTRRLGIRAPASFACGACSGPRIQIPPTLRGLLEKLRTHLSGRPTVDVALDQSHGTAETALRRALYMHQHDALEGREIVLLGDDDLVSVAVCLLLRHLGATAERGVCVLDVDARVLDYIANVAEADNLPIMCCAHDLREPLPPTFLGHFDTFATDPPYTAAGAKLFVSRGLSALKGGPGRQGFLCFCHKRSDSMVDVLAALVGMHLQLDEIIPAFNDYEGASILGSSSQMIHLLTTAR